MRKARRKRLVEPAESASALKTCACYHVRKTARAVTRLYDMALQPTGLKSNQYVLIAAIHSKSPCTLATLEDTLEMAQSTLSRNLQPLVRDGLIKQKKLAGERGRRLSLTAKGVRLLTRCHALWEDAQARFEAQMGKRKWATARKALGDALEAARDA